MVKRFHTLTAATLLGLLTVLAGCASDKLSTDYLKSRATPPPKVPSGLQFPAPSNNEFPVDNLSAKELKALDPQKLFQPPQVIEGTRQEEEGSQAPAKGPAMAELKSDANGAVFLQIALPFDQAWSRIRLGLMSSGFTITDMNRSTGRFYIRYRDPDAGKGDPDQFVLNLLDISGGSRLLVRDPGGRILSSDTARHILNLVNDNI
jgi:uncharacterized lipoprotein